MKQTHVFTETLTRLKSSKSPVVVRGTGASVPFLLELLRGDSVFDMGIIRRLARWRKKHEQWFPAQFPVTAQRTRNWLKTRVLDETDRILFMIRVRDRYIGHIGLYRYNPDDNTCEIDNIVRGVKGFPGIMEAAIAVMMTWGSETLSLSGYTLETTSDNGRAIRLYERLGFLETRREPLVYKKTDDGGAWQPAPVGYNKPVKRHTVYMKRKETT